jgi:lipopolysaccharide export system permease protein
VTTFDRYLLRSFAHVFSVCFIAMFGLIVVIDLLENLDDFLAKNDGGAAGLLENIGRYYGYQSLFFLDRGGPTLAVLTVMVVLLLFRRSGELRPMLAAGVPMYRLLLPLLAATAGVSGLLVLNQELVIPRIAHAAFDSRGGAAQSALRVEPIYDRETRISIDGRTLRLAERTIEQAEFVLPTPSVAANLTILKARVAIHRSARNDRPAGWLLRDVEPAWADLPLTRFGQQVVLATDQPNEIFVTTAVTCDQLYKRNSSYTLLSSSELWRRINSPAVGLVSAQRLVVHLHTRFLQPLLNVVVVLLILPLMVRRESQGMVIDSATCMAVLAVMLVVSQAAQYAGQMRWLTPDLVAWIPVLVGGTAAAWCAAGIES